MAMDENLTWNPTWQKWIMMGKFSSPSKNVEYQHFTKLFFSGVIFILDICVSCTSLLKLLNILV
jgi:hypothetical protein